MPWAPVNGIELYYELHGSGPAVLFAHGQGGNHLSWWQQIPFFSQHYTCITFDHRAFGLSYDADARGRLGFGTDVIALLDHLGIDNVRVVAHSMGGRSGISVALRSTPERCRALVLAGTVGGVVDETVRARQLEAAEARGDKGLGAFSVAPAYRKTHPEMMFLLRSIGRLNPPRARDFLRMPPPADRPQMAPIHERLNDANIPVCFVVGEHDLITPPDLIAMCHSLVPNSRYELVPDSGHSAYFERPDYFNDVVFRFLQDVDSGATLGQK